MSTEVFRHFLKVGMMKKSEKVLKDISSHPIPITEDTQHLSSQDVLNQQDPKDQIPADPGIHSSPTEIQSSPTEIQSSLTTTEPDCLTNQVQI